MARTTRQIWRANGQGQWVASGRTPKTPVVIVVARVAQVRSQSVKP